MGERGGGSANVVIFAEAAYCPASKRHTRVGDVGGLPRRVPGARAHAACDGTRAREATLRLKEGRPSCYSPRPACAPRSSGTNHLTSSPTPEPSPPHEFGAPSLVCHVATESGPLRHAGRLCEGATRPSHELSWGPTEGITRRARPRHTKRHANAKPREEPDAPSVGSAF